MTDPSPRESPWTVPEIAATLAVSQKKVGGWIESGALRAIDVSQSRGLKPRWRILPADFEAFLAARRSSPAAEPTKTARRKRTASKDLIEVY